MESLVVDGARATSLDVAAVAVATLHELGLVEVAEVQLAGESVLWRARRVSTAVIAACNITNVCVIPQRRFRSK